MTKKTQEKPELSAVTESFLENHTFLKKFLSRYFSNQQDIEDVSQEAYLRAFVEEQQKGVRSPKAFLFHVAKNVALSRLSKKSRQITDYLEDLPTMEIAGHEAGADAELEAQELLKLYCEAMASLPEKCRQAFILRKVHGLSHKEISKRLCVSPSSVDKYLKRGLLTCDEYLQTRHQFTQEQSLPQQDESLWREK